MNKKICPECGTQNEEQYIYCKNCGATLTTKKEENNQYQNASDFNAQTSFYDGDSYINGIPEIEYQLYIGKNHDKFLNKFRRMEFTSSKYSWCWAPAILGFLGGPLCAALWFFYRKIYKPAWVLVVIGLILNIATGLLTMNTTDAYYEAIINSFSTGNFDAVLDTLANSSETFTIMLANTLSDVSSLGTALFTGLFSHNIYKNHIHNRIMEYKTMHSDPQHYRIGLTYIGGTSGGMLALGFVLMFGTNAIVSFVTSLFALFN